MDTDEEDNLFKLGQSKKKFRENPDN